ncbi:DUF6241 domain-containing protein [Clostridium sp.]|jgi:hypothetical protein|uniref:DUF6241 domain-containing protein n=1 Tax=Clostridium sp. TaxID=1506 RepID=UPI003EEA7F07
MHKKLTIRFILGFSSIMAIGAIMFFVATSNGWDYKHYMGIKPVMAENQVVETKAKAKTKENEKEETKVYTKLEVVTMMHEMVNTLIIAEDNRIWGKKEVDKESVSELLNMIEAAEDFYEKGIVTEIANDWKRGYFDNVVQDHNIVWGILDGTVGKASEENIVAVAEAKEYLK